jgi:hypothetical protein
MSIRSTLIVATAIATLGLGSPAFAASYGGFITTRAGGTPDSRRQHEPHSPHHSSSRQGPAAACNYTPAEVVGCPALRISPPAGTVGRPPVRAPCLTKRRKMTGSGADRITNNTGDIMPDQIFRPTPRAGR